MSDQKNIDNLFREAFKDFEAAPDPALWDKISSKLDEKPPQPQQKKEGIVFLPWFYRIAGIAAAILLLFAVGSQFFDNDDNGLNPENQTTSTTNEDVHNDSNSKNNTTNGTNSEIDSDTQISDNENNTKEERLENEKNSDVQNNTLQLKENIANDSKYDHLNTKKENGVEKSVQKGSAFQNTIVTQENKTNSNNTNSVNDPNRINTKITQKNAVVTQENGINSNTTNNPNRIDKNKTIAQKNAVATSNTNASNTVTNTNSSESSTKQHNTQNTVDTKNDPYKNSVAANTTTNTKTTIKGVNGSASATLKTTEETANTTSVAENSTKNDKKATNSATETNTTTETVASITEKKDEKIGKSLLDVINDLHELDKDSTAVAEADMRRWTIAPNASPVYYNTLVNGSPISETFADNTKSGEVNLSFGVNVGYDVSSRLTIRSGIHKVDYSYNTNDVAIVPNISAGNAQTVNGGLGTNGISNDISTISFTENASTYTLTDKQAAGNGEFIPTISDSSIRQAQIEGNLNQRMSFIEVPVELKYAVIDKKIGVNVIGGVSTFFLTENSLLLDSPALTTELGEATNVNDVSFSTNIGIGIDYKISKQLEFNLEPMLKYQINTFSGNTGNFRPYSVGVYSGVSFRF
ncbi:hypothetical protein [Kordia jejudonensis]|uniref:hypothetical protein n=1 Tax=Kordia jejudonensis TaxID=1348245 RepID=UPI00069A4336|nr:hypothetical protein [Kordia jejudonensis]